MLSIDGGGMRGMISIQVLAKLEDLLREHRNRPDLVLADEFDHIAGTSTGAIIAAALAMGHPVATIEQLYRDLGPRLFKPRRLAGKAWSLYHDGPLREALRDFYRPDTTLGHDSIRTLLLCVLLNTSTDSPWPLSNASKSKYNDRARSDCNLELPLWQVVRASTAAPIYFPPEEVDLGGRRFVFQDGGITSYNNPAFIQFIMATEPVYGLSWPTGHDELLSVSIGTGMTGGVSAALDRSDVHILYNAKNIVGHLMSAASNEQDRLCRFLGWCRYGQPIDREVSSLVTAAPRAGARFSYVRYNTDLSPEALTRAGFGHMDAHEIRRLDAVDHIDDLVTIGQSLANEVQLSHLRGFI